MLQSKFITCPYTEKPTNSKSMSSPRLHWSFVPSTISITSEGSVREKNSVHIYITAHYLYTIIQIEEKLYGEVLHECVGVSRVEGEGKYYTGVQYLTLLPSHMGNDRFMTTFATQKSIVQLTVTSFSSPDVQTWHNGKQVFT